MSTIHSAQRLWTLAQMSLALQTAELPARAAEASNRPPPPPAAHEQQLRKRPETPNLSDVRFLDAAKAPQQTNQQSLPIANSVAPHNQNLTLSYVVRFCLTQALLTSAYLCFFIRCVPASRRHEHPILSWLNKFYRENGEYPANTRLFTITALSNFAIGGLGTLATLKQRAELSVTGAQLPSMLTDLGPQLASFAMVFGALYVCYLGRRHSRDSFNTQSRPEPEPRSLIEKTMHWLKRDLTQGYVSLGLALASLSGLAASKIMPVFGVPDITLPGTLLACSWLAFGLACNVALRTIGTAIVWNDFRNTSRPVKGQERAPFPSMQAQVYWLLGTSVNLTLVSGPLLSMKSAGPLIYVLQNVVLVSCGLYYRQRYLRNLQSH